MLPVKKISFGVLALLCVNCSDKTQQDLFGRQRLSAFGGLNSEIVSQAKKDAQRCQILAENLRNVTPQLGEVAEAYGAELSSFASELKEDAHRAIIVRSCFWDQYLSLLERIKGNGATRFNFETTQKVSRALDNLHSILQVANAKKGSYDLSLVLSDPATRQSLERENGMLLIQDFHTFLSFANASELNTDNLLKLSDFVQTLPEITGSFSFDGLDMFLKKQSFEMPRENQALYAKVLLRVLARFGVIFSERGRNSQIQEFKDNVAELQEKLKAKDLPELDKRALQDRVSELEFEIQQLQTLRYRVADLVPAIERAWKRSSTPPPEGFLRAELKTLSQEFASSLPFASVQLKDGDVWAQTSLQGVGNLLVDMVEAPSAFTHSGFIAKELDAGGFPIYFRAEISSEPKYSRLDLSHHVVLRTGIPVPADFTEVALRNLKRLKSVSFDLLFKPGFVDKQNRALLYCSELIHYLYKNQFLPNGPQGPSPFDLADNRLPWSTKQLRENAEILGYDPEADYFLPDGLLYTPSTQIVGAFSHLELGDASTNPGGYLLMEANSRLTQQISAWMKVRQLKKANFVDRTLIQLGLGAYGIFGGLPFVQGLLPVEIKRVLKEMDTSGKDTATLLKVVLATQKQLTNVKTLAESVDASNPEERKRVLDSLETTVYPELNKLFEN